MIRGSQLRRASAFARILQEGQTRCITVRCALDVDGGRRAEATDLGETLRGLRSWEMGVLIERRCF